MVSEQMLQGFDLLPDLLDDQPVHKDIVQDRKDEYEQRHTTLAQACSDVKLAWVTIIHAMPRNATTLITMIIMRYQIRCGIQGTITTGLRNASRSAIAAG
jgi:hypothetical protein